MYKVEIKERKTNRVICYINYAFAQNKSYARFCANEDLRFEGAADKCKVGKAIKID